MNLGCGAHAHPAWLNVDLRRCAPNVTPYDLRRGIPCRDGQCDAVYHSHLLEHLPRPDAADLLRECRRVLRPGGVLRVVVPDLEEIARSYLHALAQATSGVTGSAENYDWAVLELLDQMVRTRPGGKMREYLQRRDLPNEEHVRARIGREYMAHREAACVRPPWLARLVAASRRAASSGIQALQLACCRLVGLPPAAVRAARFRSLGEVHQWMYDKYSLTRMVREAGFPDPQVVTARESAIPGWQDYELDADAEGNPHKPDSLYLEAIKPSNQPERKCE